MDPFLLICIVGAVVAFVAGCIVLVIETALASVGEVVPGRRSYRENTVIGFIMVLVWASILELMDSHDPHQRYHRSETFDPPQPRERIDHRDRTGEDTVDEVFGNR